MYKEDLALNNNGWYAINPNQSVQKERERERERERESEREQLGRYIPYFPGSIDWVIDLLILTACQLFLG